MWLRNLHYVQHPVAYLRFPLGGRYPKKIGWTPQHMILIYPYCLLYLPYNEIILVLIIFYLTIIYYFLQNNIFIRTYFCWLDKFSYIQLIYTRLVFDIKLCKQYMSAETKHTIPPYHSPLAKLTFPSKNRMHLRYGTFFLSIEIYGKVGDCKLQCVETKRVGINYYKR